MSISTKDIQSLRASTGAGMMDCKKALEESNGDVEAAKQWLREKGLAASAKRDDRESVQGVVALLIEGGVAGIVKLKCETDFVAGSEQFKAAADTLVRTVVEKGIEAAKEHDAEIDDLKIVLKENISVGDIIRVVAQEGSTIDSYLHIQGGRGVNAVLVEMQGATPELAHDIAVHIAFARPKYLRKEDVPADVVAHERTTLEAISRNEGKPEAALPKIIEGRLGGFYKDVCLLEQPYAKDDKVSIQQLIGSASIVGFAQVEIG